MTRLRNDGGEFVSRRRHRYCDVAALRLVIFNSLLEGVASRILRHGWPSVGTPRQQRTLGKPMPEGSQQG